MFQPLVSDYREHHLTIGDTNFYFIANANTIAENQKNGTTMHSHKFYELFYVLYGNIVIITEFGNLHLSEGDCAVIGPGVTHTTQIAAHSKRIAIVFSLKKNRSKRDNKYYQTFESIFKEKTMVIPSFAGAHAFKRYTRYLNSNYSDKNELMLTCLHEIMILLKATKTSDATPMEIENVSDSNNYRNFMIDEYFINRFQHASLGKLAELLHLSPQQTQRIIKSIYHQTFTERITLMRMEHAKRLLTTTNISVTQIAAECGYTGTNGFFVAFKKHFRMTPKEMRNEAENQTK